MENVIVGVLFGGLLGCFLLLVRGESRGRNELPVERGWLPWVGVGFELGSDFGGLMRRCRAKHGDMFTVKSFGDRITFVCGIDKIRRMWKMTSLFAFEDFGLEADAALSGVSIEKVRASGVGPHTLALQAGSMRGEAALTQLYKRFAAGLTQLTAEQPHFRCGALARVELETLCGEMIWFAAGRTLFGPRWGAGVDLATSYARYNDWARQVPLFVAGVPSAILRKGTAGRKYVIENMLTPLVKEHAESSEEWHPYLADYVKALKQVHSDEEAAARLMGLTFAIFTNTVFSLFWTVARLCTLPKEKRAALVKQVRDAQIHVDGNSFSYSDVLPQVPLLNSLIVETMRFHTDPNSMRVCQKDCEVDTLDGTPRAFRKGDTVFLLSSSDQFTPNATVPDPSLFDSDRWLPFLTDPVYKDKLFALPEYQVLEPFGGGKNLCPGRFFAMLEIRAVILWVVSNYEFELPSPEQKLPAKVPELASGVNIPKQPFPVLFRYVGQCNE